MSSSTEVSIALKALEQLTCSPSTSTSGPLAILIDQHIVKARQKIVQGEDPKKVINALQIQVAKSKKDVEKDV